MPLFWGQLKRTAPETVPTDTIVPVHYWDDTALCRSAVLYDLLRFDNVLDVAKLKTSLETLIDREGWQKLGARVRLNKNKKLEYHIPAYFDEKRLPFSFQHEHMELKITDHPLASQLPREPSSSKPQILGRGDDFLELMWRPGDPQILEDYLCTDRPMLGLRVISFLDATLVTVSWSHILVDGIGRKSFLDAWSLILHNREEEVLPLYGVETDPLATLGTQPSEVYKYANKQLSTWQMVVWGLRYIFDKFWNRRVEEESRVIFVPAEYVQTLQQTSLRDMMSRNDFANTVSFLSEGDVICAWWTRHLVRAQIQENSSRTVALNNAFGLRSLLGNDMLPSDRPYVSNAFCMVPVFMTAKDILTKPLSFLAAAVRRSYLDLGTRGQIEAVLGLSRAAQDGDGVALFGDPWMHMIVCTNWSKANLYNSDFSGALLNGVEKTNCQNTCRPSFIQAHAFAKGFSMINGFMVTGKDTKGNIWLYGVLRNHVWSVIEENLRTDVNQTSI